MASSIAPQQTTGQFRVVDLCHVRPAELSILWEREVRAWSDTLDWDVSSAMGALKRAVARGGVNGRAVRCDGRIIAYAYYSVEGDRGVLSGFVVAPSTRAAEAGSLLLNASVEALERRRVRRIESQFLCFDAPWLTARFEALGFASYRRDFLRAKVTPRVPSPSASREVVILPWSAWNLSEMASLMMSSHQGGIDAQMNELYRSHEGCRVLLNNIIRQRGCGNSIAEASAIARTRETDGAAGFAIVTQIAPGHGHLAQVAVAPEFQGRGIGRRLIGHAFDQLSDLGLDNVSLMVSVGNDRAHRLYRSMGFDPVHRFPVFQRDS